MKGKIFTVLFIAVLVAMLGLGIVAPLLPVYARSMGLTGVGVGLIFAGFSLSRGLLMPFVGGFSDTRGRKQFIVAGLLLYALISPCYIFAHNLFSLMLVRILHGFASALVFPIAMAYVGDITSQGEEGVSMGTFNMSFFLGMGSGPVLGGILKDVFGFSAVFYTMAIMTGVAFLIVLLFLPDKHFHNGKRGERENVWEDRNLFRIFLRSEYLKNLFFLRIVVSLGRGGLLAFLPIFAARIGITPSQVGVIISFNIFLTAFLQRFFGKLLDKYSRGLIIIGGIVLSAVALFFVPVAENFVQLLLLSVLMGVGGAMLIPAVTMMVVPAGRKFGMGVMMGLFSSAISLSMILAPLLSGMVMDTFGIKAVFYTGGIVTFTGGMVFYMFEKKREKEEVLINV